MSMTLSKVNDLLKGEQHTPCAIMSNANLLSEDVFTATIFSTIICSNVLLCKNVNYLFVYCKMGENKCVMEGCV